MAPTGRSTTRARPADRSPARPRGGRSQGPSRANRPSKHHHRGPRPSKHPPRHHRRRPRQRLRPQPRHPDLGARERGRELVREPAPAAAAAARRAAPPVAVRRRRSQGRQQPLAGPTGKGGHRRRAAMKRPRRRTAQRDRTTRPRATTRLRSPVRRRQRTQEVPTVQPPSRIPCPDPKMAGAAMRWPAARPPTARSRTPPGLDRRTTIRIAAHRCRRSSRR